MTTIDEIGERAAVAARADAADMAARRVESGLERLRLGDGPIVRAPRRGIDPRRWLTLGVAAALAAAAIIALTVNANESADRRVVPGGSSTQVTTAPTVGASTTIPSTDVAPSTTVAPQQVVPADAIAVSHNSLPPAYPAKVFTTIDGPADPAQLPLMAIGDTRIVTVDTATSTATLIDPFSTDLAPEQLQLAVTLAGESIAVGPGDVLYGVSQGTNPQVSIVAVALSGDRAGQVVASAPISAAAFAEAPNGVLGHARDGIVDRRTEETLLGYVDVTGAPTTLSRPAHGAGVISSQSTSAGLDLFVRDPDGTHDWHLLIDADPALPPSPVDGRPLATSSSHGGAVVWADLGPPSDPNLDTPTSRVIAVLASDGSGTWYSLADGWQVGASDLDGTILMRRNGDKVELARLDPPQRIDFLNQPAAPHQRVLFAVTLPSALTSATPCTTDQLDVVPTAEGAMGTTYGVLNVRNKSDQPCQVLGVPNVAFLDDAGNVVQSTDPTLLGTTDGASPIVLEKDSWATAILGAIASNVCGGNESSQFRLTIDGKSVDVPFAVGRPIDQQQCDPPSTQPAGPVLLAAQPFDVVQPNTDIPGPFDNLQVAIEAPTTVKAGDVLRYDLLVTAPTDITGLPSDACPIYTETLGATATGQYLLNCVGTDGILINPGEAVRFHIELPIPASSATGPATLTWTPIEPGGPAVTAAVTITP